MMKQYALGIVLLSLVCLGVALKEEDCEGINKIKSNQIHNPIQYSQFSISTFIFFYEQFV